MNLRNRMDILREPENGGGWFRWFSFLTVGWFLGSSRSISRGFKGTFQCCLLLITHISGAPGIPLRNEVFSHTPRNGRIHMGNWGDITPPFWITCLFFWRNIIWKQTWKIITKFKILKPKSWRFGSDDPFLSILGWFFRFHFLTFRGVISNSSSPSPHKALLTLGEELSHHPPFHPCYSDYSHYGSMVNSICIPIHEWLILMGLIDFARRNFDMIWFYLFSNKHNIVDSHNPMYVELKSR